LDLVSVSLVAEEGVEPQRLYEILQTHVLPKIKKLQLELKKL
jgi:hypothetical protein